MTKLENQNKLQEAKQQNELAEMEKYRHEQKRIYELEQANQVKLLEAQHKISQNAYTEGQKKGAGKGRKGGGKKDKKGKDQDLIDDR